MFDVVLINPAGYRGTPRRGPYELTGFQTQLELLGLTTTLWDIQAEVGAEILPFPGGHLDAIEATLRQTPSRCYFLTSRTTAGPWVIEIARLAKALSPSSIVMVYAPRIEPRLARTIARHSYIDVLIPSSAESKAGLIVQEMLLSPSLATKKDASVIAARTDETGSWLPASSSDFVIGSIWISPDRTIGAVQIGRGCPDRCTFCAAHLGSGGNPQYATAEQIVRAAHVAFERLAKDCRLFVMLETENLTSNRTLIANIVNVRRENGYLFRWGAYGRIDHMDDEMRTMLIDGGCTFIFFGLESASRRLRKILGKYYDDSVVIERIKSLSNAGVRTQSSFIFGIPGETYDEFCATAEMMAEVVWAGGFVDWTPLRIEAGSAMERMVAKHPRRLLHESELFLDVIEGGLNPEEIDADAGYRMYGLEMEGFDIDRACVMARRWRTLLLTAPLAAYIIRHGLKFSIQETLNYLAMEQTVVNEATPVTWKKSSSASDFLSAICLYETGQLANSCESKVDCIGIGMLYADLRLRPHLLPRVFHLPWWGKSCLESLDECLSSLRV